MAENEEARVEGRAASLVPQDMTVESPLITVRLSSIAAGLLQELREQEDALAQADEAVGKAMAEYRVAMARYVAVRDAVHDQLGASPYDREIVMEYWPAWDDKESPPWDRPAFGRYQYLDKQVGVAVLDALRNRDRPITLQALCSALREGGMDVDVRAVNASLINMKGVKKFDDGTYRYVGDADLSR